WNFAMPRAAEGPRSRPLLRFNRPTGKRAGCSAPSSKKHRRIRCATTCIVSNSSWRQGNSPSLDHSRQKESDVQALVWQGINQLGVERVPDPTLLNPKDIIVQVKLSSVCGSDLHLIGGYVP